MKQSNRFLKPGKHFVKLETSQPYPGIRQAIWLLVLVTLLIVLLSILVAILGEVINVSLGEHPAVMAVIPLIAIGIILRKGLKKTKAQFKDVFPLKPIQMDLILPMVFTIIGVGILLSEVDNLFRTLLPAPKWHVDLMNFAIGQPSLWASIVVLVVVASLTEELLFRGLILHGFLSRYTVRKAILASAILFGLFHLNPWQLLPAIILGVIFAWWFVQTGSLLPCLFGHALVNAIPLILLCILNLEIPGATSEITTKVEFQPLWFDFVGLLLAGSGIWTLTRMFQNASKGNTKI
jgi:membrane protease YdiL (CAAX protease family)